MTLVGRALSPASKVHNGKEESHNVRPVSDFTPNGFEAQRPRFSEVMINFFDRRNT
jgi:hypothetical protein